MEKMNYRQNDIPEDAQLLIRAFLAEQEKRVIETKSKRSKILNINARVAPMNARQIERYVRAKGFDVSTGNGRHGKHIEARCCGASNPLPDHGGRAVSLGVQLSIEKFIAQHQHDVAA